MSSLRFSLGTSRRTVCRSSAIGVALALAALLAAPPPAFADTAQERYEKGAALVQEKKFPEARKEFEAAVKLDPKHVAAQRLLASLLAADNMHEAAAKHLEAAAEAASDDERAKVTLECGNAWYNAAKKLAMSGDGSTKKRNELCEKGILWLGRAIALDDSLDISRLNVATLQCIEEKWADAQAGLEKFLEKSPDDESALFNLARCLEETEAAPHEKAIAAWEKVVAIAKADPKKKGDVTYAQDRIKALKKDAAKPADPKKKAK